MQSVSRYDRHIRVRIHLQIPMVYRHQPVIELLGNKL